MVPRDWAIAEIREKWTDLSEFGPFRLARWSYRSHSGAAALGWVFLGKVLFVFSLVWFFIALILSPNDLSDLLFAFNVLIKGR